MGLAIFYETLLVILVSALTAAVCLSSYLVTKRKTMLFACIAFMFYFFDVASILQDDYAARELASGLTQEYYFIRSLYTMVTGAGFLGAFWFMVCEYIGECRRSIRITPIVVYAILSLILLAISGESKVLRFCYYSCRAAFMFWILAYGAVHYLRTKDPVERQRLGRYKNHCIALALLGMVMVAEDALFNYGKLQYELGGGRFNEAIQVLNRYVAQYPSSPRVRTAKELLAAAYYNSHNYDEAYEIIASYPDPDGDLLAAKQKIAYFRGLSALEKGDTEGAGRYLAESARIGISPKYNALATFWQGEIAYGRGNYDVALRDYESYLKRAPKTEPEYAMAFYNTGYCHFSKENMPRARESFVRFIELYPTQDGYRTDARNRLGDTYYSDRQFDEALKYYGQAAAASDDGADYARYQRAVTLGILGRTSEKIKALQQIIRDGRGDYLDDATYELGRTFVAQERYREGAAVLEPFVETYVYSPYRSAALSELGLAYLNLGDKKKSLSYYDMVVKTAPQSSDAKDALQGIRDIYVSEGDAGGYFDYARKSGVEGDLTAMSRDSLSFAAARRIYLSGEPASAAKSLRSYLESYPKGYYTADALYCLSDCYLKTGERSRAIETLAALADAGQNQYTHRALKMLAGMTFADERFTEAAAAYRKLADAESTAAGKAEAMNGYVRATIAAGDEERILSMADDVASYTAAGDEAWRASQFAKAGILDRRGDAAAAQKIYKVLSANVKTPEGAESAYRVIESAFRAGDTARAEKLVLDFSDKGTPHAFWLAKSFLVLGDIYVQKGDMFQARATYQSIVDGYTPADDGIVAEAKEKIKKLN